MICYFLDSRTPYINASYFFPRHDMFLFSADLSRHQPSAARRHLPVILMRLLEELFALDYSLILVFYITERIADIQPYGWICQCNREIIKMIIMNLWS